MNEDRLKDRGTIKWNSLMLPEHVEMLKEVWKEDETEEKGMLAEDQAAEIDYKLQSALKDNLTVGLKYYNGLNYTTKSVKIINIDKNKLKCKDEDLKGIVNISINAIVEMNII